jgi:hypothetical protein
MSAQIRTKSQIQKAEDLPNILSTQSQWTSIKECERSVFLSLDITLVAERRVTLLDAMTSKVNDIISDALDKGILFRNEDGTVVIPSGRLVA